jgi:hypothetical protein
MSDAWFLDPPGTEVHGSATVEWFADAFLSCTRPCKVR